MADHEVDWKVRGKTIAGLIRELESFEDRTIEVRISVDDGDTSQPNSLVAESGGRCLQGQTEDKQFAELEVAREAEGMTWMAIPTELVPEVRALLAREHSARQGPV